MSVYYNEIEPFAVAWLRNLMAAGHIPKGDIDDRPIQEVRPSELVGYTQCHFFAGIAGWPLALGLAGWGDRPVWTGSCPCQPFSAAGKQRGADDERHLWPYWRDLIEQCRPATVFGEQVASPLGRQWLAGVRAEMETLGYAVGAADLCAASIGAPHIRQRLWFGAQRLDDTAGPRRSRQIARTEGEARDEARLCMPGSGCGASRVADAHSQREGGRGIQEPSEGAETVSGASRQRSAGLRSDRGMDHTAGERHGQTVVETQPGRRQCAARSTGFSYPWDEYKFIPCADGKARRIEPGTFPLAHGVPARVGKLRAYGNAIVPQIAAEFVSAFMETCD